MEKTLGEYTLNEIYAECAKHDTEVGCAKDCKFRRFCATHFEDIPSHDWDNELNQEPKPINS